MEMAMLGALVYTAINFLKYLRAQDWNGAGTQLCVWLGGVGAVMLFSQTDFGERSTWEGVLLSDTDNYTRVFLGMMAASLLSPVHDLKKAWDRNQSSITPALFPVAHTKRKR